ncbi:MAG: hypothetical protein KAI99_00055, partial [Cyclobacteriaceae bacterium]|nr:hypothetical protein [Cyclobacteriaceae bacterium]
KGAYELDNYWDTYDKKHLKTAHSLFDRALQIDPEFLKAIQHAGNAFLAEENYDSAFIYADRLLALDPEFGGAYALKGVCYFFMGKSDLAIENYLKAIDLPPKGDDWLWYHVELGREYLWQKNDVIKALPYFKKGLESEESKHLSDAYNFISESYLTIGNYERAEEYLRKGMELGVGCGVSMSYSWWLLVQGEFREALQFAEPMCQQLDCEWSCYRQLFKASLLLEEFEKAEQYFYQWQNAPFLSTEFALSRDYQIAYVYHQLGKTEEAELILTKQANKIKTWLNQGKRTFWYNSLILDLSRIYAFQGDRKEAIKYLAEYAKRGFTRGWHDFILIDPFFESLLDDPVFKAIVKQAQDEKAALRIQVREMEKRGELDL